MGLLARSDTLQVEKIQTMTESGASNQGPSAGSVPLPREKGGYDCVFVEPLHDQLQTKCPVCLCVLRDPYLIDCCGYSFCRTCIKTIQDNKNPCPLCNGQFTAYPDKRLCRTLKAMQVCCVHVNLGCEWKGALGDMDKHLNSSPPDCERREIGCVYENVCCDYCNDLLERQKLIHHQLEVCPKRPFSCDYCHEYQSTRDDVTLKHWLECPCRPVSCPNECGAYPERRNLQRHLCNECQMALVKCQFSIFGCEAVVMRKDTENHLKEAVVSHLSLQSEHYGNCFAEYERKLRDCEGRIADLENENLQLKSALEYKNSEITVNMHTANNTADHFRNQHPLPRTNKVGHVWRLDGAESRLYLEELEQLKSQLCTLPVQFTVHSVAQLQRDRAKWISTPFYTHAQGYKMCLKVYPGGHSTSIGSDLSLYVCIMKGKHDDFLKWPFRGSIVLQLVDQVQDMDHVKHTVKFSDDGSGEFSGRLTSGEVSGGWGILKFVSLDRLVPKYLHNDSILIKVLTAVIL